MDRKAAAAARDAAARGAAAATARGAMAEGEASRAMAEGEASRAMAEGEAPQVDMGPDELWERRQYEDAHSRTIFALANPFALNNYIELYKIDAIREGSFAVPMPDALDDDIFYDRLRDRQNKYVLFNE